MKKWDTLKFFNSGIPSVGYLGPVSIQEMSGNYVGSPVCNSRGSAWWVTFCVGGRLVFMVLMNGVVTGF
jgi:hypothetical protein